MCEFELLDKVTKGTCIDTKPQQWQFVKRKKMRVIRPDTLELSSRAFRRWLNGTIMQKQRQRAKSGIKDDRIHEDLKRYDVHLYPEKKFYKTHHISRDDFLTTMDSLSPKEQSAAVERLRDDPSVFGRSTADLREACRIIRKHLHLKLREKYAVAEP